MHNYKNTGWFCALIVGRYKFLVSHNISQNFCERDILCEIQHQVCDARIREHSRKPDEIRDRIVELCGDLPRIELFARQKTDGWDVWGNETDKFTESAD